MLKEMVKEGLEQEAKKHSLVVVGLDNNVDSKKFVDDTCNKLALNPEDVEDVFRHGAVSQNCSMDRRARRGQCTTRYGIYSMAAMTKRLRGGMDGNESECSCNRSRGRPNRDGRARGMGPSQRYLKTYRPQLRHNRKSRREEKRCVETRIARQLETIHPNPGPSARGTRNRDRNRQYRRMRKYTKRQKKRSAKEETRTEEDKARKQEQRRQEESRPPKIVTWNIQKTSLRENNRRRLREIATFCVEKKWDVVMLTEVTSQDEGFFWMGEDDKKIVVIHGKKAAIMLTGKWADDWTDQGSQRWLGNRTAAVKVNHFRLVCGYQPLWNYGDTELHDYRTEVEEQIQRARACEWLVIGGDHNATIGLANEHDINDSEAVGRYGIGQRNEAGRDLVRWCEENGLVWVNSFYVHNWRGTWCHPARSTWYELDGFIMKKSQMGQLVKQVRTVMEDSYSDHRPKMMVLRKRETGQPNFRQRRRAGIPKINWEALQDKEKRMEYRRKTEEGMRGVDPSEGIKWERIASVLTKSALETCGKRQKELSTLWVAGREAHLVQMRRRISEAVQEVRAKKTAHDRDRTEESKRELEEAVKQRKIHRREHRITMRAWEREYWEDIIEQTHQAQQRGNYGEVYRTLRRLGQRGSSKAAPSVYFTPEEFKEHFSKASQHEFERDAENWTATIAGIMDKRNQTENLAAGRDLERTPSEEEIWKAIKDMKDKAPGEDGVRISYVKQAAEPAQKYVIKTVQDMFEKAPEHWEEMIGNGLVIPLFKKGDRKDRNNYRGVCLLSMGSRILARVLATRIRKWSKEMRLVDDNQQGFRSGRSTMDATQILVRIQEETVETEKDKAAMNRNTDDAADDPAAVLLDITKAYPRVNRPAMWTMLERAGMGNKCLRTIRGIHEKTTYKVKGREECSTTWRANRGLREGCATSPSLFNIYHAEVMRQAKIKREEECRRQGREAGIKWMHVPGNSFPPRSTNKAMAGSDTAEIPVTEALFADDTTLIGYRSELMENVNKIKEVTSEKCHDGKEEWVFFGKEGSENVRMLGTWLGRDKDVRERLARGSRAWWMLKKRLCKTTISKKTQARILEACVESTMLFDCAIRPWLQREVKKLQQQIDRSYRYVWMNKKGGPGLRQMEEKGVNMYDIRKELDVDTIDNKIARRALERINHLTRMEDTRLTKKVILGWQKREQTIQGRKSRKNTTITFWRKILRQAGIDVDTMEMTTTDREKWRKVCQEETRRRRSKDEQRCKKREDSQEQAETQTEPERLGNTCDWPGCGDSFDTKSGLVQHQRIKHKRRDLKFECPICDRTFMQKGNLTNHIKTCRGVPQPGQCPRCQKIFSKSNIAGHVRDCGRNQTRQDQSLRQEQNEMDDGPPEYQPPQGQQEQDGQQGRKRRAPPGGRPPQNGLVVGAERESTKEACNGTRHRIGAILDVQR